MKHVQLYKVKGLKVRDDERTVPIDVTSKDVFKFSIEQNQDNFKGIERLMKAGRIIEKINAAEFEGKLILSEDEYKILKESINKTDYSQVPFVIHVPHIIEAVEKAETVET